MELVDLPEKLFRLFSRPKLPEKKGGIVIIPGIGFHTELHIEFDTNGKRMLKKGVHVPEKKK